MPQKSSNDLFREISVLAQRVPDKDFLLGFTACMNPEEREIIGYIYVFKELFKDNSLDEYLKAFQMLGRSRWMRTELTDLGLILGENIQEEDF
jgi:hypothetical protein